MCSTTCYLTEYTPVYDYKIPLTCNLGFKGSGCCSAWSTLNEEDKGFEPLGLLHPMLFKSITINHSDNPLFVVLRFLN